MNGRCAIPCLLALCWLMALSCEVTAQEKDAPAPPARVGQLSKVSSHARMRVDRDSPWEPAVLNTPVTTGSALAADNSATAEVRVGSTALRLAPNAQVQWVELNDKSMHIEIISGIVALRVRMLAPGERVLVSAGGVKAQVLKAGAYRVRHLAPETRLAFWVQEGQARLALNPQEMTLGPNQHVIVERKSATLLTSGASDERKGFDEFVEARDRRSEHSFSLLNISAEITGAEALDDGGSWRNEPSYGAVWFPDKVPSDWAPYRFGRWRWLAPWGWTWIDDAPWGFATSHYGRWVFTAGRWAWVPGQQPNASASSRPVYAPALVGFYGNRSGAAWTTSASATSATPVVGWYPLAPGEIYWPAYSTQLAYIRGLNAGSVADTAQIQALPADTAAVPVHRFARAAIAASAMPYAAFISMQDVASHQIVLSPAALAQAPLSGQRPPPALTQTQ